MIDRRPCVVIVGRPNVGKSTLFNRLYGGRRSITDPTPGVTRDAVEENIVLAGIPVKLVDTGGVKAEYEDAFDDIVADRALTTLKNAEVILLLMAAGELTAEDQLLVKKLRPESGKVVLIINKCDTPEKDYMAAEFYALGLGEPIPISSAHGRNIDAINDALHARLANFQEQSNDDVNVNAALVVALVGKPNAGKSTLANRLTGREYSLVSDIAGTTRDTIIGRTKHRGRPLKIIDTAGMRRKARVSENVEYYSVNRAIQAMYQADVTVLLIDAGQGLSDQDKKITSQAVKKGRTVVMVLNKWDEEAPNPSRLKKVVEKVRFQFPLLEWAPLIPISALNGYGVGNLLDVIIKVDRQQNHRVDTSELNRAVGEWVDLTPPPTGKGRPYKVKYITQVSAKPVRFVAFVNRKKGFPDSYRRFLINQIRREFGFMLVPVELVLKESGK